MPTSFSVRGKDHRGSPSAFRHSLLRKYIESVLGSELRATSNGLTVSLGDKVAEILRFLIARGDIDEGRVLMGLEHPSGANIERIQYLVGRKARDRFSRMTTPDRLERARQLVEHRMASLLAGAVAEQLKSA